MRRVGTTREMEKMSLSTNMAAGQRCRPRSLLINSLYARLVRILTFGSKHEDPAACVMSEVPRTWRTSARWSRDNGTTSPHVTCFEP